MRTVPKTPEEKFADLFFPERGVNDAVSHSDMPAGYTPLGTNVRTFEALTGRGRGGSRSGLTKWIPELVAGVHEIQHLAGVVSVDASLVGWSTDDGDVGFPGQHGGIGFIEPIGGGGFGNPGSPGGLDPFPIGPGPGTGGGGYQPSAMDTRIIKVGVRSVSFGVTVIAMADGVGNLTINTPAGQPPDIVIRIRITNQDGQTEEYVGFESVTLYTFPNGELGDAVPVSMEFDLTDPPAGRHGLGEFEVWRMTPGTVFYYAISYAISGAQFRSRKLVRINWKPEYIRATVADSSLNPGDTGTVTGVLKDYLGNVVPNKAIRLRATNTDTGAAGDKNGTTATTNGSGEVTFSPSEVSPGTFEYLMEEVADTEIVSIPKVFITFGAAGMWDYRFDGGFNDHFAVGPDMVGAGTIVDSSYVFTAGQGLVLPSLPLSDNGVYTIEILFSLDFDPAIENSAYKILDFNELTAMRGMYFGDHDPTGATQPVIKFATGAAFIFDSTPYSVAADTVYCFTLVRTAGDLFTLYVDGVVVDTWFELDDSGPNPDWLKFSTGVMTFFQRDSTWTPPQGQSGGTCYRIRIYDRALDETEVADAFATITDES